MYEDTSLRFQRLQYDAIPEQECNCPALELGAKKAGEFFSEPEEKLLTKRFVKPHRLN